MAILYELLAGGDRPEAISERGRAEAPTPIGQPA